MIVSGADIDECGKWQRMLTVCELFAKRHYPFTRHLFEQGTAKQQKVRVITKALRKHPWAIWMDADSVLFQPIPEVIEGDHDIAICVKEPPLPGESIRFGSYFYSGFVFARKTVAARQFLQGWASFFPDHRSDQRALHEYIATMYTMGDHLYDLVGETIEIGDAKVLLLDSRVYVAMDPIREMRLPRSDEKIIHFKGALHIWWRDYSRRFLW